MGVSPYTTRYQHWCRRVGLLPDQEITPAMQRGTQLEPIALAEFEKEMGLFMAPTVRMSRTVPWMIASLDGLSLDGKIAVEIKCPGRETHQLALDGKVPDKYIYQLQHQMLVLNVDLMYYFSFDGRKGKTLEVRKDAALQEKLLSALQEFWLSILNFEPPELTERDYIQKTDADWAIMANRWKQIRTDIKKLEQEEEDCRNAFVHMANQQNAQGFGVRLQAMPRKGNVDYTKIPELTGVNLEQYRKPATKIIRLTEVK
jgi:putative phage-type endonuclease